jgi:hypothetical protein
MKTDSTKVSERRRRKRLEQLSREVARLGNAIGIAGAVRGNTQLRRLGMASLLTGRRRTR